MVKQVALRLVKSEQRSTQAATEIEITVREWLLSLRQARYALGTIEKYGLHLERLLVWLHERGVMRVQQLDRLLLREWGAEFGESRSAATTRQAVAAVRSFLRWCWEEQVIGEPLGQVLKLPRVRNRVQRSLTGQEVHALLEVCDDSVMGKRDAALVSLMVDSGLRVSEVCRLEVEKLHFEVNLFGVQANFVPVVVKGGREELAYFGQATVGRLKAWLEVRRARNGVGEVFVSLGGNTPLCRLTRSGVGDILERLSSKVGIEKATPHSLRRAFAVLADEAGASTRQVQEWGRWSDIRMVELYTRAMQAGRLYGKFSPVDYVERGTGST